MSRDTSLTFRQAINANETSRVFIVLVEISGDELDAPIRVCSNSTNVTSNSNEYAAYPFDITFPDDSEDGVPTCKITIDNVARELTEGVRSLTEPPTVRIMVVLDSAPNTIEVDYPYFKLTSIDTDQLTIEGNISIEGYTSEPFPGDCFTPANTPGLF